MYNQRNFGVYFILSSDTGPKRFLFSLFFLIFFLFIYLVIFLVAVEFEFDSVCFVFLLTYYAMRVGKQTSKLLEKILILFAVYTKAFDQSH